MSTVDGVPVDASDPWRYNPLMHAERTLGLINTYKPELEDEFGEFTTQKLPSGRILLRSHDGEPFIAYLSDFHADARLVIDDYIPELDPEAEDDQTEPKT